MDDNTVILVTVPVLIAIVPGIFRMATLRTRVSREWSHRVDVCISGLDELALQALYDLHARIEEGFDQRLSKDTWPDGPPLDPSSLKSYIDRYAKALKFKNRLLSDIKWLRNIGPTMVIALAVGAVGVSLLFIDATRIWRLDHVATLGYLLGLLALSMTIVGLIGYTYLCHRLANTEHLAREGVTDA